MDKENTTWTVTKHHIPSGLRERQQWLCYRLEYDPDNDRYDKIPKAPRWTIDGDLHVINIGVNSDGEWSGYDQAAQFVKETQQKLPEDEALDGVGYVLTEDDPYVFLDLDDHVEDNVLDETAEEWVQGLDSWTEVSQSGNGLHTFVEAPDFEFEGIKKRNDEEGVELYDQSRFCAITGDTLMTRPDTIETRTDELREVADGYLSSKGNDTSSEPIESSWDPNVSQDVDVVIKTAEAYDDTFATLHDGGTVHQDVSHDDVSYLCKCFFWSKGDESVVRDMARESYRYRHKWGENRQGATWFDKRIDEAKRLQDEKFRGNYI